MGIVRRQSIKTSLIILVGVFFGYLNSLWIFPYCLQPEEIGLVRLLVGGGSLLATFIPLGIHNVAVKYFPYYQKKENNHSGFFLFIVTIPLIGGVFITLLSLTFQEQLMGLFKEKSSMALEYLVYILPLALIISYHQVLIAFSRSLLRAVIPNFFQSILLRVLVGCTIILYYLEIYNTQGLVYGYLITYSTIALLILFYIKLLGHLHFSFSAFKIPFTKIKEMLKFGAYVVFTNAGEVIVKNVDIIMLGALAGLSDTGIYSVAFYIGILIEIPKRALTQTSIPLIAQARKQDDLRKVEEIFKKSSLNQFLVGALIFIGVWVNLEELFMLIPNGEIYLKGKWVVIIIGGAKLLDLLSGLNGQVIMTSRFYRFNPIAMGILALLTIGLNYLLIPPYGLEGAAIASLIAITSANFIRLIFLFFKEGIHPFSTQTIVGILLGGLVFLVGYHIPEIGGPWLTIFVRSLTILLLFGTGTYLLKISMDANELLDQSIKRYLKR